MSGQCLVKGCPNHPSEGVFVGDLCAPFYIMLTEGKTGPSQAWFVTTINRQGATLLDLNHKLATITEVLGYE